MSDQTPDTFRWQAFFQQSTQPLFLVNRRRRILFANRAWEACTGIPLAEARGRVCRRRSAANQDHDEAVLSACAPPSEAMRGEPCQARRRAPQTRDWWDIRFFPLLGATEPGTDGLLGILGAIRVLAAPQQPPFALPEKLMALRDRQQARYRLEDLGSSTIDLVRLQEQARLASSTSVPVTIVGETGAGKEWLARAIHAASPASNRYFISLDATRLPGDRIGALLFEPRGQQLGAGTVFLREPASLPREWQGRLVETLAQRETREFPRIIVGFSADPLEHVRRGELLGEFHGAASTILLRVPPMRERLSELPRIIEVLLLRAPGTGKDAIAVQGVGPDAMEVLRHYAWPGNVRELQEVLRGACRRAKGDRIETTDLPFHLRHGPLAAERHLPLDALLEKVETRLIALAMRLAQDNHTRAAELLEIWRPRLLRRLEKLQ